MSANTLFSVICYLKCVQFKRKSAKSVGGAIGIILIGL